MIDMPTTATRVTPQRRRRYRQPKHSPVRLALLLLASTLLLVAATVAGVVTGSS